MSLLEEIGTRVVRIDMLKEAFYAVVERTNQQREGYYVLRQINELDIAAGKQGSAEATIKHLENMAVTIEAAIERFDR